MYRIKNLALQICARHLLLAIAFHFICHSSGCQAYAPEELPQATAENGIEGYWIREKDHLEKMVIEIVPQGDNTYIAKLLNVPEQGHGYGFEVGDHKLKSIRIQNASKNEYSCLTLFRESSSEYGYNEATITQTEKNAIFIRDNNVSDLLGSKQHWRRLNEKSPESAYVLYGEAKNSEDMGLIKKAAKLYHQSAELEIDDNSFLNDLAWTLAVSQHTEVRNAKLAVRLSKKASEADANASYLDTYAAALAASGDFARAIEIQERALASLRSIDQEDNKQSPTKKYLYRVHRSNPFAVMFVVASYEQEYKGRLELYRQSKPYRQ